MGKNSYEGFTRTGHSYWYNMDYIFFGIVPNDNVEKNVDQGYSANGVEYNFNNCDNNERSQFTFYPTHSRKKRALEPIDERSGEIDKKWKEGSTQAEHTLPDGDKYLMTMLEEFGGVVQVVSKQV